MRFLTLSGLLLVALAAGPLFLLSGCAPATTYNRGLDISFHPSSKADAQERILPSAIELKTEADTSLVKDAGGVYLGELEVVGEKAGGMYMGQSGGSTLSGRISLEAASRGATHFYLASSNTENSMEFHHTMNGSSSATPTSKTKARFILFRVEQSSWEKLPQQYRPEAPAAAKTSTPAAPAASGEKKL